MFTDVFAENRPRPKGKGDYRGLGLVCFAFVCFALVVSKLFRFTSFEGCFAFCVSKLNVLDLVVWMC